MLTPSPVRPRRHRLAAIGLVAGIILSYGGASVLLLLRQVVTEEAPVTAAILSDASLPVIDNAKDRRAANLRQIIAPVNQSAKVNSIGWNDSECGSVFVLPDLPISVSSSRQDAAILVDYARHLLLPSTSRVGPQHTTICTASSPFLKPEQDHHWLVRLVFAALYHHQHGPARAEARTRLETTGPGHDNNGTYTCHDAKFLVAGLSGYGIGANIRSVPYNLLMAGVRTNRTVLLLETGTARWKLASCTRGDYTCVFARPSPCVLTSAELMAAPALSTFDLKQMVYGGTSFRNHDYNVVMKSRVIRFTGLRIFPFQPVPRAVHDAVYSTALSLIDDLPNQVPSLDVPRHQQRLREIAGRLLFNNDSIHHMHSIVFHTALLYFFRPNAASQRAMNDMVRRTLASISRLDSNRLLGLPIRASDKCDKESQCLTLGQHLQVGAKSWQRFGSGASGLCKNDSLFVLVTTESTAMKRSYEQFVAAGNNRSNHASLLRPGNLSVPASSIFFTNPFDVTPDTGFIIANDKTLRPRGLEKDDAMLSSLTTFHLQLHARVTVGNCCSNFHSMLKSMLHIGCGHEHNYFHCLHEDDDPLFAVCCNIDSVGIERQANCAATRAAALRNKSGNVTA